VTFCQYTGGSPVTTTASGTTNYVARWTSATTIGTGTMYDSGSAVGLNTASPQNLLDVNGAASIGYNVAAPTNGLIVSGNVGVGTTSPATGALLDVWGNEKFGAVTAGNPGALQLIEGPGSPVSARTEFGTDGSGWQYRIAKNQAGTVTDFVTVQDNGNVGIGTTLPSTNLVVQGSVPTPFIVNSTSGTGTFTQFESSGTSEGYIGYSSSVSGGGITFLNATGTTNNMVVTNSGNVGIGTASPSMLLQLRAGTDSNLRFSTAPNIFGGTTGFGFQSVNDALNAVEPLVISGSPVVFPSGNVGIGTTSPGTDLEIDGAGGWLTFLKLKNTGASGNYWTIGADSTNSIGILNQASNGVWIVNGGSAWNATSDIRLKKNIKPIGDALEKLTAITGVTFNWRSPSATTAEQVGVIAQDVKKVFPQLVATNSSGTLGVNYSGLVAPLIQAVKELKADNDNLRAANDNEAAQIKALTARLDALEAARH
jgi:hypothetical protein